MQSGTTTTERMADQAERATNTALGSALNTGMMWWDMMLSFQREMQRASLQSLSSYSPTSDTRVIGQLPRPAAATTQVVSVGEERLNVATHTIQGETTRVRRRVVSQPVEQQVTLRQETVVVERRPPMSTDPKPDVLTETIIEMSDSRQVPTVWKSTHVAEEVVLRKQVTERVEKVRDTVRRDVVDVEHPNGATAALAAAAAPAAAAAMAANAAAARMAVAFDAATTADVQPIRPHQEPEHRAVAAAEQRAHDETADKAQDRKPVVGPAASAQSTSPTRKS